MWELLGNHDPNADLKVENFIVVHNHVNCPAELFSMGLRVHLQIDFLVFKNLLKFFIWKRKGLKPSQWGPHGFYTTAH